MSNPGPGAPLVDLEAQANDTTAPPQKSPLEHEDSEKHSDLPEQGQNGVHNGEERVQDDSAGLIWPLLLVVAILLSLANQQFWPRNQAIGSGVAESRQHSPGEPPEPADQPWQCAEEVELTPVPYPDPTGGGNERPRYHARGSVKVPVAADIMSFVNMYEDEDGCAGTFRVSQTGERGSAEATVDVDVSSTQPEAFRDVRMCRLHRTKNDVGDVFRFGIDTPATDGLDISSSEVRGRALHVDIHLRLPQPHAGSNVPLEIKELHTALHQYDHLLSTPPSVHFKKLNLSTVMAWIESESVSGDMVSLQSTYNSIRGSYNISRALVIQTEDGLVNITAQLHNDDASESADPTVLNVTTIEGAIFSEVSLHSASTSAPRGVFDVSASTGHAPIVLTFLHAPPSSVLTASAEIVGPDGDWLASWGDTWDPSYWDLEWDLDPSMPNRVAVQVHESFEGAIDLEMTEPTAFRPQVLPLAEAEVHAGAEVEGSTSAEGPYEVEGLQSQAVFASDGIGGGASEDGDANALKKLLVSVEDVDSGRWDAAQCVRVRRVDADPLARDGRAVVGGILWGAEKLSDEELQKKGKIVVRTVDSPIALIV